MTVKELIDKLLTMPPDTPVIYACCSDWSEMSVEDVSLKWITFRGDRYCTEYAASIYPDGEPPLRKLACTFPGN